jgi:glucokinase
MDDVLFGGARLLADIGGTNARFALQRGPGRIEEVATLACADHATPGEAVRAYMLRHPGAARELRHAVIAIANPVDGDFVRMTNHCWEFSIEALRKELALETLLVVNDFAALSMSVPQLPAADLQVGGRLRRWRDRPGRRRHRARGRRPDAVQWTLERAGQRRRPRSVFAIRRARTGDPVLVLEQMAARVGRAPGLGRPGPDPRSPDARDAVDATPLSPAQVVERGLAGSDALCAEALDVFCGMLGTMAANVAVTLCARGGIYIGGGVVPRLGDYFGSSFRARFENKGRFSAFAAKIPCFVIHAPYPALPAPPPCSTSTCRTRAWPPATPRSIPSPWRTMSKTRHPLLWVPSGYFTMALGYTMLTSVTAIMFKA